MPGAGVPVIAPLVVLNCSPLGNGAEIDQVKGATPPDRARVVL